MFKCANQHILGSLNYLPQTHGLITRRTHYSADDVDDDDNNSHHSAAVLLLQKGISTLNDRTEGERERERVAFGVFVVVVVC